MSVYYQIEARRRSLTGFGSTKMAVITHVEGWNRDQSWSKYKRREYDVIFVKPTGSPKMAVKLRLLDSIL